MIERTHYECPFFDTHCISDNHIYEINGYIVIMEFLHFTYYSLQDKFMITEGNMFADNGIITNYNYLSA